MKKSKKFTKKNTRNKHTSISGRSVVPTRPKDAGKYKLKKSKQKKRKTKRKKTQKGKGDYTEVVNRLIKVEVDKAMEQADEKCCKRVAYAKKKADEDCCEKIKTLLKCMNKNNPKEKKKICNEFMTQLNIKKRVTVDEFNKEFDKLIKEYS
jgi:hypothetical protein